MQAARVTRSVSLVMVTANLGPSSSESDDDGPRQESLRTDFDFALPILLGLPPPGVREKMAGEDTTGGID
jgi:hypothetical protein